MLLTWGRLTVIPSEAIVARACPVHTIAIGTTVHPTAGVCSKQSIHTQWTLHSIT